MKDLGLIIIFNVVIALCGFIELTAKEKEIGSKDILLEENPIYNIDKKSADKLEKIREEYEDTEFEIPGRILPLKMRNLIPNDSNNTLAKFESKQFPISNFQRNNSASVYGGTGYFIGGNLDFRKLFNHGQTNNDFGFSMLSFKVKDETYDYFENRGKYILDSGKTDNNYQIKGLSYLNEKLQISYDIGRRNSILYLQNNPYFHKQKKILNELKTKIDFTQSDKIFHRAEFISFGFQLENESRNFPNSNFYTEKSRFRKYSTKYEIQFDPNSNLKIFSILDYSFYSVDTLQVGKFPSDEEKNLRNEGRFRAGIIKKEEGDFLHGWIFKSFWNIHFLSSEKNLYGGEIFLGFRYKDFLLGGNYQNSGKILDYYDSYIQNDLGDMNLDFNRNSIAKTYFSLSYETTRNIRVILDAGEARESGKFIWIKTKDYFFHPEQRDVQYGFYDIELNVLVKKYFQIGGEISYRNYTKNNLPYLPKFIQSSYIRFLGENYSLELKSHYMSNMNKDEIGNKIPHQRHFDFLFYYALIVKLDFRFEIRNLEDRELFYREDFYLPGRQILFGIRMNF